MDNILIIKFGALGDVIRTSFILEGLREKFLDAKIYWLTSNSSFDLLRFNPYIEHLTTPTLNLELLYKMDFDLVISLDDEIEILRLLKNIKYKDIIGSYLDNNDNPTYDDRSSLWFDMGLLSKFGKEKADLLKKENKLTHKEIMERILNINIKRPLFFNSRQIEDSKKYLFEKDFFNVGINSGAGGRWLSKQIRMDEAINLINTLLASEVHGKQVKVFLLGGETEYERHMAIKEVIKSPYLIDTGNENSLLEFAAIIKHLDYVISSDSLALHLAIAQGVPNLSFYSPTSAEEIETFGNGVKVLSMAQDYCSYRKDADNSTITSERILDATRRHLIFEGVAEELDE